MDYSRRTFNKDTTPSAPTSAPGQEEKMRYKAAKYHYKIQQHLHEHYVSKGAEIPQGYAEYLQPFRG